jgi:protoheme IX farnesyltransferase
MLPVVAGTDETRRQILIYTLILLPVTFLPALIGTAGPLYATGVAVLAVMFLHFAIQVYRRRGGAEGEAACKKLFAFSTSWLFLVFALILIERGFGIHAFAPVFG